MSMFILFYLSLNAEYEKTVDEILLREKKIDVKVEINILSNQNIFHH